MSDAARAQRQRLTGSVVSFKPDKAYGFIAISGKRDLFFHLSEWIQDYDPRKGDRVSFIQDVDNSGRPHARQIVVVE